MSTITILSNIAEIEHENIIVQTMAGRIEKARQGKWNGGFAPYGYKLVNGKLEIEETEAEAIKIIFEKYAYTDMGSVAITKYLAKQGLGFEEILKHYYREVDITYLYQ